VGATRVYGAVGSYGLIGGNDLGVHCLDGNYAVYAILQVPLVLQIGDSKSPAYGIAVK
jgi:hypothetical protein